MNAVPVPIAVPPVAEVYHEIVPAEAEALKSTVPGPQRLPEVESVMAGIGLTVTVTDAVFIQNGYPPVTV